jgi:hypothetical protein
VRRDAWGQQSPRRRVVLARSRYAVSAAVVPFKFLVSQLCSLVVLLLSSDVDGAAAPAWGANFGVPNHARY